MENFGSRYKEICSSETVYSRKNGFFYEVYESAKQSMGLTYVLKLFTKIKSDEERIINIFEDYNIRHIVISMLNNLKVIDKEKNAFKSKRNRLQSLKENEKVFKRINQLNQAVIEAPEIGQCKRIDDGYSLPLAIVTRADISLKNNEYILAYEDFKKVLKFDIPFMNRLKIFEKILLCRNFKKQMSRRDYDTKSRQTIKDPLWKTNSEHSTMSRLVKINESIATGKEASANHVINPGDALIFENPIASCLLPNFYHSHCQTCFKRFKLSYGCPNCGAVSFCSYKCRDIGLQSYHNYECRIFPYIVGSGLSILSYLALRIIIQLGLENCLSVYQCIEEGKVDENLNSYLQIYYLEKHHHERSPLDFFERTLVAVFLVQCLKQINFFDCTTNSSDVNKVPYNYEVIIGTLLLKNLQVLQFNAHEIYEIAAGNDPDVSGRLNHTYIGVGIYPRAARFNHECYSAIIRYFYGNKIILRSSRLLQTNDVIAENYGPIFFMKEFAERQRYLAGRYWFNCCCPACKNKWPLLNNIDTQNLKIRCKSGICLENVDVSLKNNCEKQYFCQKCSSTNTFSKRHQNIIKKCILWYSYAITIMDKQYLPEAAESFLIALKIFHHVACPPHRFTHLAEIGLQHCLLSYKS